MGKPYNNKNHLTHGLRKTRLYRIWANMKTRCYNTNDPHYKDGELRELRSVKSGKMTLRLFMTGL